MTTWFIEFRTRSYKARQRTAQEIGDYKGIKREVLSDLRLRKVEHEDTEMLIDGASEIRHWNDVYKQQ
jgi:hypothetical protein